MRKLLLPTMLSTTLLLGGCMSGLGGGLFDDILGGGDDNYGYNSGQQFERAAANACGREASRFGQIRIESVKQDSRDTVKVKGRINVRDSRRNQFSCIFRSDNRIVDFRRY
ncbi:hypothetical protein [Qipengyuania marisflavi]|uniref:Lipoprotein n=1 Tax=Qipengyuania marisflavi TaxID=2486356 RepID=A0A5S3P9X6_9SPHN|nr:hypothetical protein [Qipengyuania marisflavi]TMM50332.1 hypothetical protein FEV51_03925 [Qipengyuania marisflavi]